MTATGGISTSASRPKTITANRSPRGVVAMLLDRVADVVDHRLPLVGGDAERLVEQVDDGEAFAAPLVLDVGQREAR